MAAPVSSGEQQQPTPVTDASGAVPKPHPERIARKCFPKASFKVTSRCFRALFSNDVTWTYFIALFIFYEGSLSNAGARSFTYDLVTPFKDDS